MVLNVLHEFVWALSRGAYGLRSVYGTKIGNSGVFHDSTLGPLILIAYINDIKHGIINKSLKVTEDTKPNTNVDSGSNMQRL